MRNQSHSLSFEACTFETDKLFEIWIASTRKVCLIVSNKFQETTKTTKQTIKGKKKKKEYFEKIALLYTKSILYECLYSFLEACFTLLRVWRSRIFEDLHFFKKAINPFYTTGLFQYPQIAPKNLWFSGVFKVHARYQLHEMGKSKKLWTSQKDTCFKPNIRPEGKLLASH